jgi:hypothetical protein
MMARQAFALVCLTWVCCARLGGAQSTAPLPSLGNVRVGAQIVTGTLATPIGFFGGGLATRWALGHAGASEETARRGAYVGGWTIAALATAGTPALIGARGPGAGSYPAALGGAVAGGAVSWGLIQLNRPIAENPGVGFRVIRAVSAIAVFTLPSIGATIAYNATRDPVGR